jgi:chromosome condensin MukBEF MukE localization factor
MISFVLCWLYLSNDRKISEIGNYITYDLSTQLSKVTNEDEVFIWEKVHKTYTGRRARKLIQFIVDILIFAFPALSGLLMILTQSNNGYVLAVDILFFIGVVVLFVVHYSDEKITQEE